MKQGDITIQGQADILPYGYKAIVSFDLSTTPSGSQSSITGVGFKPNWVQFYSSIQATKAMSIGSCVRSGGALYSGCIRDNGNASADTYNYEGYPIHVRHTAGEAYAYVVSFDSDGFTIQWAITAVASTLYILFLAHKAA